VVFAPTIFIRAEYLAAYISSVLLGIVQHTIDDLFRRSVAPIGLASRMVESSRSSSAGCETALP